MSCPIQLLTGSTPKKNFFLLFSPYPKIYFSYGDTSRYAIFLYLACDMLLKDDQDTDFMAMDIKSRWASFQMAELVNLFCNCSA